MADSRLQAYRRNLPHLPFKIWHNQSCANCSEVLTIGYVMIGNEIGHVCGKCMAEEKYEFVEFIKSLYNNVAAEFAFSCRNCYTGCTKQLSLLDMIYHAETCEILEEEPAELFCELCPFQGSQIYDIVLHSRRSHMEDALFKGAKVLFSITADEEMKKLYFLEDGIFVFSWIYDSSTMNLKLSIECISIVKPRRFSVRIENPGDPTNYKILQSTTIDLVFLDIDQDYNELNEQFGFGALLSYELIVENLPLDLIDQLALVRYDELREKEERLERMYVRLKAKKWVQDHTNNTYKMTLDILKNVAPSILKCSNCHIINPGTKLYYCSEGHVCCRACMHPKCEACMGPREFNLLDELKNFVLHCDWPGCKFETKLHYYLSHKATCTHRTYHCPLKGCCKPFTSITELQDHWHACTPALIEFDRAIAFNKPTHQEFFWVFNHDVYRVLIKIDEEIEVVIEDFDVVFDNNRVYCYGIKKDVKEEIKSRILCGYVHISIDNRQTKDPTQFIYEQLQIEIVKKNM